MADHRQAARRLTLRPGGAARVLVLACAALAGPIAGPGAAATPADDPRVEARARAIGKELRCLVCQNQSIDDSDAELAQDLRRLVRERVVAGDSDQAVIAYVVSRYGDFVRLKPPFKPATYALWLGPAGIAALATLVVIAYFRRRRPVEDDGTLALGEEERLARLLHEGGDTDRQT